MIKRTKNVTLVVSEEGHRRARMWAARCGVSMSGMLAFVVEHIDDVSRAIVQLHKDDPNWGMDFPFGKR